MVVLVLLVLIVVVVIAVMRGKILLIKYSVWWGIIVIGDDK